MASRRRGGAPLPRNPQSSAGYLRGRITAPPFASFSASYDDDDDDDDDEDDIKTLSKHMQTINTQSPQRPLLPLSSIQGIQLAIQPNHKLGPHFFNPLRLNAETIHAPLRQRDGRAPNHSLRISRDN